MAGVGFQLKKLFVKKGFLVNFSAYFYSTMVTTGPMIICVSILILFRLYLKFINASLYDIELFSSTVVYSFIFSFVLTGGFVFIISRYAADSIYIDKPDKILSSFYGVVLQVVVISSILGIIFYFMSPLSLIYKFVAYLLFMELCILWIETPYLSTVKNFMGIIKGFFLGALVILVINLVIYFRQMQFDILIALCSIVLGFFTITTYFAIFIRRFYYKSSGSIYDYISYFDKFKNIFFTGFFVALGAFIHNIIIWFSQYYSIVGDTYRVCSLYDVPTFYSVFTTIPTIVLFVVYVETSFYEKYRDFYSTVLNGGNINEIKLAKSEMNTDLMTRLFYIGEVQFLFSLLSIIIGVKFLPLFGFTKQLLDIFVMLTLSQFCYIIMYVLILILLYFDDRKGAFKVASLFLLSNTILTLITVYFGVNFYGFGFFLSAFISMMYALRKLVYYIENLEYFTFCSQPLVFHEKPGFFTKLVKSPRQTSEREVND